MAQSYTGLPEVSPSVDGGGSYQTSHGADSEAFGGGIAQGIEAVGQGLSTGLQFFGKVAADDASNQFQDFASKLLHGDPSKMVAGPDGSQVPDTGYLGTRGRAALDQRPGIDKALKDKIAELRKGLSTPEQQLEFDNFSKRYRTGVIERVGNHADQQSASWYTSVNTATAKLALDQISNNFDNPKLVAAGAADLTSAYVKNAQIKGGSDLEIRQAINDAKRDALGVQLDAMAVTDPSRAMRVLEKNRDIAGVKYDEMANKFRARAEQQSGITAATEAIKRTYQPNPQKTVYTDVQLSTAGAPYGVPGDYLRAVHALEGDGVSKTGAKGPFQFIDSTAKQYGVVDPFNPEQAAAGAARLAAANKAALGRELGRTPTWAEVYLAHQQGAGGAAALLENPNMGAAQALVAGGAYKDVITAARAIRVNGGDPNAPASQFTGMWAAKFNGAPGMAVAQRKASAMQAVLENPDLSDQARSHAITYLNQQMAAQKIAMEEDAASKKQAADTLQSSFVTQIIKGSNPNIIADIANSPLDATQKENLYNFAVQKGGIEDTLSYGPGYTSAMNRMMLPADNPSKLWGADEVIALRNTGALTRKGAEAIIKDMNELRKNPDQVGITTTRASQLKYYQRQMAIDSDTPNMPGVPPFKNLKGLDKYDHEFVPAVEAAYNQWVKKNGDPMEFWNDRKRLDAIMDSVYPPSQRKADSLFANGQAGTGEKPVPAPAAPDGADKKVWDRLMAGPPKKPNGEPWQLDKWGKVINDLTTHANEPGVVENFNKVFGPTGWTAEDVLKLYGKDAAPAPTGPSEPSILSKAVENVLHYGRTGRGVTTGYHDELILDHSKEPEPPPGVVQRALTGAAAPFVKKGEVIEDAATGGIRG